MRIALAFLSWLAPVRSLEAQGARPARGTAVLAAAGIALAGAGAVGCGAIPHESDARRLTGGDPSRGREHIRKYGCDTCHTIPGIPTADANVGPPLARIARRVYLAGRLANTPENMRRWIEHPQAVDERSAMPDMGVTVSDSRDIVAYLYTLR